MKRIDLGQAIAILANVGVIAGIVFLAFESQWEWSYLESREGRLSQYAPTGGVPD